MANFQIPLQNVPQSFQIALAGIEYILTCKWNDSADAGWVIDLADALTSTPIVANIPLVTGVDLLAGLEYLGIPGKLFVFTDGDDFAVPTLDNLGVESNVYFQTEDANV
ncbi:hypothetical protein UFOVP558_3 [uncultured Caudovirales phage]|uniref:Cyanophage baseplate Pam3 plug gp18 domain-containing protein n=1 Tax=uncultured Caudovirales phage TaxID=2100421 RepID=A0A6J5MX09_9CAUD|nr:hypothetical protein UFOVP558_3 [uncultured Caudovirales phage]